MSALIYAVVVLWFWLTYEVGKFPNALYYKQKRSPDCLCGCAGWLGSRILSGFTAGRFRRPMLLVLPALNKKATGS
jgi:hypothetical protein